MSKRTLRLFKSCTFNTQIKIASLTTPIYIGQFINLTATLITLMLNLFIRYNIILKYFIVRAYNVKGDLTDKVAFPAFLFAKITCYFIVTSFIIFMINSIFITALNTKHRLEPALNSRCTSFILT